jgi:hypothetical protein
VSEPISHGFPVEHGAPTTQLASHIAELPLQNPPGQALPAGWRSSGGQLVVPPLQLSGTSHTPADARHVVPAGATPSAGHAVLAPVHVSPTSQASAAARHVVPAGARPSAGQFAPAPVHDSGWSHGPIDARHDVPAVENASGGHSIAVPVHISATSQVPAAARHTVAAATTHAFWQQSGVAPVHASPPPTAPIGPVPQWQLLPVHASAGPHATPQPPQCDALVVVSVSQPFAGSPSQSPNPARHVNPHTPAAQSAVAFARAAQGVHPPQWSGSLEGSTSHPVAASPSQSRWDASHG